MKIAGFRAGTTDVSTDVKKNFATTSEANQWKIHKVGEVVATSTNQIFTIEHGLGYTPAILCFVKNSSNTYYSLNTLGGANWVNKNTLSIQLSAIGDKASYIIFKDFGA
jgi:hypothetical protein